MISDIRNFFSHVAVPLDSRYSDVDIRSDEIVICSEITPSCVDKHEWCKISQNSDLCSATVQNMRYLVIHWMILSCSVIFICQI
jgi:hypothetical protein